MGLLLVVLALFCCAYLFSTLIEFVFGFKKIKNLTQQTILKNEELPSISVILSVLNEEHNIENVLKSLTNLTYPKLEIIIVNDRSSDSTPDILERYKQKHPQLNIHHIEHLPEGWFGKNHALHYASQFAKGDWILFTDADVTMKSDTLLKTISYAVENKLDHLTIHENHYRESFWLKISLLGNYLGYSIDVKPWRVKYSWSKKAVGRGAFNLVRAAAYHACGGHQAIAMQCLDDLKLGALFKKNGFHQDIADGQDYVDFKWYDSLKHMIAGLEKNGFAYYNYRLMPALCDIMFALLFFIWPIVAVIFCSGWVCWSNLFVVFFTLSLSAYVAKQFRLPIRYAVFYPLAMTILVYTVANSIRRTYKNNGVIWRGTHYSLKMLRAKAASEFN